MKKTLLLALAGILATQAALAQGPQPRAASTAAPVVTQPVAKGNGKISGLILDGVSNQPIEFATVTLADKATGSIVDGAVSDGKGKFSITRIAAGAYKVSISFVGYETTVLDGIAVEKGEVNLGTVRLKTNAKALGEVTVVGEKPLIEDKVDRTVYNAEKDLTNTGGTASDVLKKVPGLTVDLEGNVALRGSSNIRVLINNKPSTIMASDIADALRQIPADLIKSVEVITSPSARYDAEGTAGIINIITKKNSLQGVNGTVNAAYGTRISNVSGNLNYRKGKLGMNTAVGRSWRNNPMESNRETFYTGIASIDRLSQQTEGKREGTFHFLQFGTDYDLSSKSSLAAGVSMKGGKFGFNNTQTSTRYLNNGIAGRDIRVNQSDFDNLNYDINLDYTRQFAKPGQELAILGLLSRNNRDNRSYADIFNGDNMLALKEQNLNEAFNEEKTAQLDYTHPLKNKQMLELGAKAISRYVESDYRFLLANPATAPFTPVPNRTDVFSYDQNVAAAYATYGFTLNKKYNVKLGTRYEYTQVSGDFVTTRTSVKQDYDNMIPSIAVSRSLKNNQTVKFNYTKRIQRPQLFYLNPFENRADTFNIQVGNPDLQAELTHSYELGYSTFFKSGASINASLFWRQTNNAIQAYTLPTDEGINYTRFGNIGHNATYGLSLFGSAKFLKKGNISGNVNLYYADLESESSLLTASNASAMYNANLNVGYAFSKGISAQMFGEINSRRVTLQGKASASAFYNLAVKKDILKNKGSISAGIDNPFAKAPVQKSNFKAPGAEQQNTLHIYNRQLRVSANYKFGKIDAKSQPRRRKKINNDDAKADGDAQ